MYATPENHCFGYIFSAGQSTAFNIEHNWMTTIPRILDREAGLQYMFGDQMSEEQDKSAQDEFQSQVERTMDVTFASTNKNTFYSLLIRLVDLSFCIDH